MKPNDKKLYNKKILTYKIDITKNNNLNHKLKKSSNYIENKENVDNNINNQSDKEDLISTELCLDEIKLKGDYDKIESELIKLRNINYKENETKFKENKSISGVSINSNNEGDLFYYSDDDEKDKEKENIEEKNRINEINIKNIKDVIYSNNNQFNNIIDKNLKNNNNNNKKELSIDLENIEYGIDETGNPINLKQFDQENGNIKNNKIIAYIIQPESNKKYTNYLIDLNGEKIPKMPDGDFNYLYNNIRIIIRNFDVQNPKLRTYGARERYSSLVSELGLHLQKNKIIQRHKGINNKNVKKIKEDSKTDDKSILLNSNNINKENILYKRKKLDKNEKNDIKNKNISLKSISKSNSKIDIIKQTKNILNKNEGNFFIIKKENDFDKIKNNLGLKNIYLNNLKNGNRTSRENQNIKKEINNNNSFLKNNIFNNKSKENFNIKTYKQSNKFLNSKYNKINSGSNSIKLNNTENLLLSNSATNMFKNSFSFFHNNKIKNKNNPLLQKSKSPRININKALKGIECNIKKIESNIKNALQKIIITNKNLNNSFKQTDNNISFKKYNSFNNSNNTTMIELPKFNNKTNYNKEIKLHKKYKISTSPIKGIKVKHSQYSVLSKQADEMIKKYNYSQSTTKININKNNSEKSMENMEYMQKIIINKRLVNSLRSSPRNKINYKKGKIFENNKDKKDISTMNLKDNSILRRLLEKSKNLLKYRLKDKISYISTSFHK